MGRCSSIDNKQIFFCNWKIMIMDILLYTTICIECNMYIIYTYSYLFVNMYISFNQETLLYFDLVYFHFVSVFDHSLLFFVCSHLSTFRCKGSTGRKHGKYQSPIDNKFFKTLRNQIDCGFLKNLSINYLPYFPFCQYSYLAHKRFEMTVTPE